MRAEMCGKKGRSYTQGYAQPRALFDDARPTPADKKARVAVRVLKVNAY
jgi:hypothetical protein